MGTLTVTDTGPGTFTVPADVTSVVCEAWGGGGAGAGNFASPRTCPGGGGGGYASFTATGLTPGGTIFYNVGAGGFQGSFGTPGMPGLASWINPSDNSQPTSNGAVATGGAGGQYDTSGTAGGTGTVGTVSHTGGNGGAGSGEGSFIGGGGGGGAGSAGNGGDGQNGPGSGTPLATDGGAGGVPDGGDGGFGANLAAGSGKSIGGGGGGEGSAHSSGGNGANGQVRLTWGSTPPPPPVTKKNAYIIERLDNRIWPTVENCWCVDCGFTLARPTPAADLNVSSATGAGIPTGVSGLVGGENYSASTTAQIIDGNGLGPGTGATVALTIASGVIMSAAVSGGSGYIFPNLVFNDPSNGGGGASGTVTLDNSATFTASAPVFALTDVGSVIRTGYGVAVITAFTDNQKVIADILAPIVQVQPDEPAPPAVKTQLNGTWTMTEPVSQFYLPQLVGLEITGLADGQIIPPTVVPADGLVTLAQPASAIIVGLAFQAQLQSTYLDAGEPTVQGQRKKIAEVTVRVEQSAAFQVGANQPDGSVQSPQQLAPQWQNMVDAPTHAVAPFNSPAIPLYTGDVRIPLPGGFNVRGQVALQQLNPLPLQVLDLSEEILGGDEPAQKAPARQRGKGEGQ